MAIAPSIELFRYPGTARVDQTIHAEQRGRVYYGGTYWPAQLHGSQFPSCIEVSKSVTVVGRQGLTLLVIPNL